MKGMPSVAAKSDPSHTLLNSFSRMKTVLEIKICKTLILRIKKHFFRSVLVFFPML